MWQVGAKHIQIKGKEKTLCQMPCPAGFQTEEITSRRDPSSVEKLLRPTTVHNPNPASCSTRLRFLGHSSIGLGSRFSTSTFASSMPDHGPPDNVRRFHSSEGGCSSSSRISKPGASAPLGRGSFFQPQPHSISCKFHLVHKNIWFQLHTYFIRDPSVSQPKS